MVATKQSPYEEFRLRRVEENKKRMESLNLPILSRNLHPRTPVKTSPMKKTSLKTQEKQLVIVRRSSRLSNSSSPVYTEIDIQRMKIPRRVSSSRGRGFLNRGYISEELREEAISRAEKLQDDLGDDYPVFVKSMLPSHVSGCFWLGLPSYFCKSQLGKDGLMTLIDEEGEEFETVYLARKTGLSGGWMGFSIAHNLAYGDALVFQLVRPTAFKVYIIRIGSDEESQKIEADSC